MSSSVVLEACTDPFVCNNYLLCYKIAIDGVLYVQDAAEVTPFLYLVTFNNVSLNINLLHYINPHRASFVAHAGYKI